MDVKALSQSMNYSDLMTQVDTAVLSMNLDIIEEMGASMIKMMEQSVTPNLGQNIDISI